MTNRKLTFQNPQMESWKQMKWRERNVKTTEARKKACPEADFNLIHPLNYLDGIKQSLPVPVHSFVVLQVVSGGHVIEPGLTGQVPLNGSLESLIKFRFGFPAQLIL